MLKKSKIIFSMLAILALALTGCGSTATEETASFDTTKAITVVSREDGSGTRGAFVELFGVEQKDASGTKVDYTTDSAIITNSTSVMMTNVASNQYAIGYISLGSLNDTVKALQVDGVDATVDNIKAGTYKISRPFNIATKGEVSEVAQDFINFILSAEGQAVVEDNGYISLSNTGAFTTTQPSGKVVVGGSSSVTPVMEKLKEAYLALNPNAEVEVQQSDSTTGMTSAIDGIVDIGMASRELKESELSAGLTNTVIAMDGIAVIVNNENTLTNITSDNVKAIFTGEITTWASLFE
ncbi:MAG: substrate-binding domain-containing protein [Erysipelotrichaceae bacterium]|nr:substrate-binding domain-containing protein [Erysipelotrichaceae bacterium]